MIFDNKINPMRIQEVIIVLIINIKLIYNIGKYYLPILKAENNSKKFISFTSPLLRHFPKFVSIMLNKFINIT